MLAIVACYIVILALQYYYVNNYLIDWHSKIPPLPDEDLEYNKQHAEELVDKFKQV